MHLKYCVNRSKRNKIEWFTFQQLDGASALLLTASTTLWCLALLFRISTCYCRTVLFTHRTLFARCTHLCEEGRNDWEKKTFQLNCYAFIDVVRAYDCTIDLQTGRRPGTISLLSITILFVAFIYLFIYSYVFSRSPFISGGIVHILNGDVCSLVGLADNSISFHLNIMIAMQYSQLFRFKSDIEIFIFAISNFHTELCVLFAFRDHVFGPCRRKARQSLNPPNDYNGVKVRNRCIIHIPICRIQTYWGTNHTKSNATLIPVLVIRITQLFTQQINKKYVCNRLTGIAHNAREGCPAQPHWKRLFI